MRDDVMSYGKGTEAVSALTLAAMEDLGFYLANYSAAQCMSWGHFQGCGFVTSRCAAIANDQLARPTLAPTASYLLVTSYDLLLNTHYSLLTTNYLLPTTTY